MSVIPSDPLKPRKTPRQARSAATVAAIFEATFQVLLTDGLVRLTTTRVAERAGVSVGTMYQYFPHKQALLYALLDLYLEEVVVALEDACLRHEGEPLHQIADGLAHAYLEAKLRHMPGSRALYAVAAELDTADLIGDVMRRVDSALTRVLASARDTTFDDLPTVTFALRTLLVGTVRAVLETDASPPSMAMLRAQLPVMCRSYLMAASRGVSPSI
ncbi:TetR/AcrR family transcriptional regulator [Luteibacter sp. 9135]|uniref:TetR/AcrR family transcriptional regulator n=1 Tax=Luteibacter sp. 9135 TaxID=1500893 RepID=UPI000560D430|nr:TetR/AcrR family transcriptional regulator [Luteibacter sp. 9135]